jgi:hypothetical protein
VAPGDPTNTVDLTPGANVAVGLLSTPTFNATHVAISSVLFGVTGTEAPPTASTQIDLNGDGRKDLKLTFSTGQTGIDSTTTLAMLSATDPSTKKTFYESASVMPING